MAAIVPVYYAPNIDTGWERSPGACTDMQNFLPTRKATYGSAGVANYFGASTLTNTPLVGYMFRKVDGTVRLLSFHATGIDEYDSSATRTSRASGLTTATDWSAAANGNAIVAVTYTNATQVSTGGAFSGLGGGSPKARHIVAQSRFLMMADYDDGTNQFGDGVWWSALGDYTSWTVSSATQAGNVRLLDTPGPIRCLATLRDTVVAFKDDSLYVGQYVGPPFFWAWRLITNRIGCVAQHGCAEYGGVLYFMHSSGVYSFDGSQIVNIGVPVAQQIGVWSGLIARSGISTFANSGGDIRKTHAITDDIEGTILFGIHANSPGATGCKTRWVGYNVITQRWGYMLLNNGAHSGDVEVAVKATFSDINTFKANTAARGLILENNNGTIVANYVSYPGALANAVPTIVTGMIGSRDKSAKVSRVTWRTLPGSTAASMGTLTATGYTDEAQNIANGTASGVYNAALDCADFQLSSKYRTISLSWGNTTELFGIGLDLDSNVTRP